MLQNIHQKEAAPRASSLYCKWIQDSRNRAAPLVAVWMDSEMRGFRQQFAPEPEESLEDALEEPGGALSIADLEYRS